jgi:hypothetical protein
MTSKDEAIVIFDQAIEMMNLLGDPIAVRADRVRKLLNQRLTDDQNVDVRDFMAFGNTFHQFMMESEPVLWTHYPALQR